MKKNKIEKKAYFHFVALAVLAKFDIHISPISPLVILTKTIQ